MSAEASAKASSSRSKKVGWSAVVDTGIPSEPAHHSRLRAAETVARLGLTNVGDGCDSSVSCRELPGG